MGWMRRTARASAVLAVLLTQTLPLSTSASVGSGVRPVFVPVTPCRLFDTRASAPVGSRSAPIGSGDTAVQQVTGSNGNCVLPTTIAAVALNVTTVNGTEASFLTIWPSDAPRPLASSLNWVAGSPPRPNKVDVAVSVDGRLSFFNHAGMVDVIADVVGYYVDHNHDDRYVPPEPLRSQLPTHGEVPVAASEFVPVALDTVRGTDDTCAYVASVGLSQSYLMDASVPLPVGARVTRVDVHAIDMSPTGAIQFDFGRRTPTDYTVLAHGTSAGVTDTELTMSATVPGEVVDHDEYFIVSVEMTPTPVATDHQVCGIEVFYDIPVTVPDATGNAVFLPVVPCRLFDTRASSPIGPRNTPLTAGEEYLQPVIGFNSNCGVRSDATAVALNVTAVGGTQASFLTIWPADVARPQVSSLNWTPSAPPTPNKVDVKLSADGKLRFYNHAGTVDIVADLVGYYTPHDHDDRYLTRHELDTRQLLTTGSITIGYPAFRAQGSGGMSSSTDRGCAVGTFGASLPVPVGSTITKVKPAITAEAAATHVVLTKVKDGVESLVQLPEMVDPGESFQLFVSAARPPLVYGMSVRVCGAEVFFEAPSVAVPPSSAASGVFVPIAPCRLADTRPSSAVGVRTTPLAAGDTHVLQVTGTNGNCTIPTSARAVALNVTAVNGTTPSFLTIWPSDATRPLASSLNWVAAAPPTPNKVDVKLSADGRINLYNFAGSVDIVADVVGYYTNHDHDDRYITQADIPLRFPDEHTVTMSGRAFISDGPTGFVPETACMTGALASSLPIPADVNLQSVAVDVIDAADDGTVQVDLIVTPNWGPSTTIDTFTTGLADAAGARTLELAPPGGELAVESGSTYTVGITPSTGATTLGACATSFTYA